MKTLLLDIETTPNLAHVWKLWDENVGLDQLRESSQLLCFAAKWLGAPAEDTMFWSVKDSQRSMVMAVHVLLGEADAVMTWNGKRFDIPHLNREFLELGLKPPSPYKQIDLCEVVKRQFRFPSNKLQYVSKQLGLSGKVGHEGHSLWVGCMEGDPASWRVMEEYNRQDVILLDGIYQRVQPWVPGHPSHAADQGIDICPKCSSPHLQRRGLYRTAQSVYQRFQCQSCGAWSRATKRDYGVTIREVANG